MKNHEKQEITPRVEIDQHLTTQEIKLYATGKLHGASLLAALIHLEHCDECHQNLPVFNEKIFLRELLADK